MVSKFMTSLFCVCLLVIRSNECHQILRGKRSPENAWVYDELVHRTDGSQLSHPQQSNNKNTFEIIVLEAPSGNESPTNRNDPAKPQVPISLQASNAVQLLSLFYDGKQYENGLQEKIPQQNLYTTQPKEEPKYAPPYDNNEQLHESELPQQDMGLMREEPVKERDRPPHNIDAPPRFYNWGPPTRPPPPRPHHPPPPHHPPSPHNWNPPPPPPPDDGWGHDRSEPPPHAPPENGWGRERRDPPPHAGGPPGGRGPPRPPPPPDDKWGHDTREPPPPPPRKNGWERERRDPPPHAGGPPGSRGPPRPPPPPDDKWEHDTREPPPPPPPENGWERERRDPPPHAGGPPGSRGPPPPPPPPDDKWEHDTREPPPPPPPENGWERERRDPPPHAGGPPGGRGPPPHARGRGPPPHARGPPHRGWESMAEVDRKRFDESNNQEELPAQSEKAMNKIGLKDTVSNDSDAVYDRYQGRGVPLTISKGTQENIEQLRPQPHLFQVVPVTPES